MKVNLTNEKVFNIVYFLKNNYKDIDDSKYDNRFKFVVYRTLSNLESIFKDILKLRESNLPEFKEFDKKKINILNKYSIPNKIGEFENEDIKKQCQEDIDKLIEEYKEVLKDRMKEIENFKDILNQEVEVDIVQCKFECIPKNFDFNNLRCLIKESDEELESLL